jgi:hypothetical protein
MMVIQGSEGPDHVHCHFHRTFELGDAPVSPAARIARSPAPPRRPHSSSRPNSIARMTRDIAATAIASTRASTMQSITRKGSFRMTVSRTQREQIGLPAVPSNPLAVDEVFRSRKLDPRRHSQSRSSEIAPTSRDHLQKVGGYPQG